MQQNKMSSVAIALCIVAFFTMGSAPSASAGSPTLVPVTITGTFDLPGGFPNPTGTFTITGAFTASGNATMNIGILGGPNGTVAHCVVTLTDNYGTITIDQQCQFATSMPAPYLTGQGKGRWEIVGGTGAYANLFGNGSLTMPGNEELMTGFIYR